MILVTYASVVISAQILFCFLINLVFFRRSPRTTDTEDPLRVSVLIPARNESKRIRPVLQAILESEGVVAEILVLDDQSEDSTAEVVNEFCVTRNNVRLIRGIPVRKVGTASSLPATNSLNRRPMKNWCFSMRTYCWQKTRCAEPFYFDDRSA